jgi:glucose/arabinose dehydrogenase
MHDGRTTLRVPATTAILLIAAACGGNDSGSDSTPDPPGPPAPTPPALAVERAYPNLTFSDPVALARAPADATRWFVVEQGGRVRVFEDFATVSVASDFVDLSGRVASGGETGLLNVAFAPDFPDDPRAWIVYTADGGSGLVARVAEFSTPDGGLSLDPNSEQVLLTIAQPQSNHNGGALAFGPDRRLYIGVGDGGGANDPHGDTGNGQRTTTLLGKLLRIDVTGDDAAGYTVPDDNPFAANPRCDFDGTGAAPCPEIYAWGFRNPWRFSFDRATGDLWVGDVGQSAIEEVDRVQRGANYGWRCFEGTRDTGLECGSATDFEPPVAEYGRDLGASITGGFVYRGTAIDGLAGRYVFGDFISGRLFQVAANANATVSIEQGDASVLSLASFAEDLDGELLVVDYSGAIFRIVRGS